MENSHIPFGVYYPGILGSRRTNNTFVRMAQAAEDEHTRRVAEAEHTRRVVRSRIAIRDPVSRRRVLFPRVEVSLAYFLFSSRKQRVERKTK